MNPVAASAVVFCMASLRQAACCSGSDPGTAVSMCGPREADAVFTSRLHAYLVALVAGRKRAATPECPLPITGTCAAVGKNG